MWPWIKVVVFYVSSNSIAALIVIKRTKMSLGESLGTSHLDFLKPIELCKIISNTYIKNFIILFNDYIY